LFARKARNREAALGMFERKKKEQRAPEKNHQQVQGPSKEEERKVGGAARIKVATRKGR